jgi:hypothetical protein
MTPQEWNTQWRRLDQFRVGGDADRGQVEREWFAQLKHFHVDAVDHGITQLIGSAKDTFLPGLGLLKDFIQSRFDRYDRTHGKCETCHGSGWVDAPIFRSHGLIYANAVTRCTACGIPAPKIEERGRREPVNDLQTREYLAGRFGHEQMPTGCEAKPWREGAREAHTAEMMAEFQKLRLKLFGSGTEAA